MIYKPVLYQKNYQIFSRKWRGNNMGHPMVSFSVPQSHSTFNINCLQVDYFQWLGKPVILNVIVGGDLSHWWALLFCSGVSAFYYVLLFLLIIIKYIWIKKTLSLNMMKLEVLQNWCIQLGFKIELHKKAAGGFNGGDGQKLEIYLLAGHIYILF